MAEVQAKLQALSEDYQKLQQELQAAVQSRQKLQAQRTENVGVQKEFDLLKEGESIYKLVGPVLLKQDKVEAEGTVKGRLEFIGKEVERTEQQIKEVQEKIEKKKTEIIQTQSSAQAAAQAAPSQVAAKG
ncbi:Prefoldin subunit 6 [Apiospora phragmitis]|uniref:Prefoldin subunit 6 n=1 Tax=Apiospora phragmitis TaxID=2905665 RepID=A0ABR1TB47_9PEZI